MQQIREANYDVKAYKLDAFSYGLPQRRRRVYIIAVRLTTLNKLAVDFFKNFEACMEVMQMLPPPPETHLL